MENTFIEEMIRQRTSSDRKGTLVFAVTALIIMGALFFFKYLEVVPIHNVEEFLRERSRRHPYVKLENALIFNTYYTLEETTDTKKDNFTYFLFIDREEEYRMFLVQLRGIVDELYFEGITIEGELKRLTSTDREVVDELIYEYGMYKEDIIVTGLLREKENPHFTGWLYFIIVGISGLIFLIISIPRMITYKDPSRVPALRKARIRYDSIVYNMESAARSGRAIYSDPQLLIAEGGIFGIGKNGWMFTPMQGLLLVSICVKMSNIAESRTEIYARFYFSDRKVKTFKPDFYQGGDLRSKLIEKCPGVLVDSDKKLQRLFKKNIEKFKIEVADRLTAQKAETE
jgi:hypothetical protein